MAVQWVFFVGVTLVYSVGAIYNGSNAYRDWFEKNSEGGPSIAPLVFGVIGMVAVVSAPFGELSERLPYLWIPIVLDCGSGPYFLCVAYYIFKERNRK